jgi:hypothetical protein
MGKGNKLVAVLILLFMLCSASTLAAGLPSTTTNEGDALIEQYINAVNCCNYQDIAPLFSSNWQEEYQQFFSNPVNSKSHYGVYNIDRIKLIEVEHISGIPLFSDINHEQYSAFADVNYWLVHWDLAAHSDSNYFSTGQNYALFVTGYEQGAPKLLDMAIPPREEVSVYSDRVGISSFDSPVGSPNSAPWSNPETINFI